MNTNLTRDNRSGTEPLRADAGGSDIRTALNQDFLRQTADEARAHFPRQFSDVELVLIDVDPHRVHAFWNLPPLVVERMRRQPGMTNADMILRLLPAADDASVPAPGCIDVEVGGFQGGVYVDVWQGYRRYRAILGLRGPDGTLFEAATSNEVTLPAERPEESAERSAAALEEDRGATGAETSSETGDPFAALFDLEAVLPVSSYILSGEDVAFEAVAELHIRGRVQPGSTVRLFGRPVVVRPDGSFAFRRILPNDRMLLTALLAGEAAGAREDR